MAAKWVGPMWSQIDDNLILRYTPAKTQFTSGAEVVLDLAAADGDGRTGQGAGEARRGPLIVNPRTGLPYMQLVLPSRVAQGPQANRHPERRVWNRDMRAGGGHRGAARRARPTIWPRRPVTPTSAPPPRSMTATGLKRPAASQSPQGLPRQKRRSEHGVS